MDIVFGIIALALVINKVVDWLRELIPDALEAKVLIPLSWAVGMFAAWVFSLSDVVAKQVNVGDMTLADLDIIAVLIFGFIAGAGASVLNDVKPNRLSAEQVERAVKQADTVVVETAEPPAPVRKSRTRK